MIFKKKNLNKAKNNFQLNNLIGIFLDSIMIAFLLWLIINPVITKISHKLTSTTQIMMISHREIGSLFLSFLIIYYPLHIVTANGFSFSSLKKITFPVQGIIFVIIVSAFLIPLWKISHYSSIFVLGIAFVIFELSQQKRAKIKRFFDLVLILFLIFHILNTNTQGIYRTIIIFIALYSINTIIWFILSILKKTNVDFEPWGNVGIYFTFLMIVFSIMMNAGANFGNYSKTLPLVDYLHYLTSVIFITVTILHLSATSKKLAAENKTKKIISLPITVLAILFFISWEIKNIHTYQKFAAPTVNAKNIKTIKVSKYSYLKGYYLKDKNMWFAADTQSCGLTHCHSAVTEQHNLSAHGKAYENKVFKQELGIFIQEKGRTAADYCIACHAPFAVINYPGDSPQGKKINPLTTKELSFTTGITCVVCHRAVPEKNPDKIGNASLTIKPLYLDSERYLGEEAKEITPIQQKLIYATTSLHKKKYHIDKKEADYICGACHLVRLPTNLAVDGKERRPADHYTSFIESAYAQAGFTCANCHQQRFETFVDGYYTANHHYLGSGSSLPYNNQDEDTKLRDISLWFLAGIGDITLDIKKENLLPPCLDVINNYIYEYYEPMQRTPENPFQNTNGKLSFRNLLKTNINVTNIEDNFIKLKIDTTNFCIGHSFPSGGGIKGYLEVKVLDSEKKVIGKYGGLKNDGLPFSNPTNLGSKVLNKEGKLIQDRRFWSAYKVIYKNYINPGETKTNNIILKIASGSKPSVVEAKWFYLRPEFFRNKERGIKKLVPPVVIGMAKTIIKN